MSANQRDLEKYISEMSSPEDPLLHRLDRETNLNVVQPRMISGHIQGKVLEMLTRMISPATVLEIGTFTGYSTLCLAAGSPETCIIDTVEPDDELSHISLRFFAESPVGGKIHLHTGSALDIVPQLGRTYDLVFIDGDKREYPDYYRMLMGDIPNTPPSVRSGSFILADNILWYGKVLEEVKHNDIHTQRIIEFNRMVRDDERVENVILPLRDGISLIRVK